MQYIPTSMVLCIGGNYVFVSLRGDIVHLIDFNAHSNFQHNMFLNDDDRLSRVPYNIRYISQRGLGQKFLTLGYDRRSLTTYLIRIDPMELIEKMTSKMIYPVISYVIIGLKSTAEIMFLLRKILHEKATDFQAKSFLQELLTGKVCERKRMSSTLIRSHDDTNVDTRKM